MDMKKVISEMYDHENEDAFHEAKTKMLSISVDADHASMLRAISERFGKSLSAFAGSILEEATLEAFWHLSDEDKVQLAEKADKETSEYLAKRGIKVTGTDMQGDYEGSRHWGGYAHVWAQGDKQ